MRKVLIIEDNKEVRENTAEILELENFTVITAENGKLGIERARKDQPDIIICDIMMPEINGYDVLDALSNTENTGSIPFVFLTSKSHKSDIRKGMNLGADDYLTKPFDETQLIDAIKCRLKKNEFLRKEFSKNIKGLAEFLEEASNQIDLDVLLQDDHLYKYKKGETIFMDGDAAHSLYFIDKGAVKIYQTTESGKELLTGIFGSGEFIGQLSLLGDKSTYIETATTIENTEVYKIPKEDFVKLLYQNRDISRKFIKMVSNNLIKVQEQLIDIAFSPVRQRVAKALIELDKKNVLSDSEIPGINIAREDFAAMIGTATETAIRMLTEFKKENLITTASRRKIVLVNKEALEYIANYID